MACKYIIVPNPVSLLDPVTDIPLGDVVTFKSLVLNILMHDPRWKKDVVTLETAMAIVKAVKKDSKTIRLEKEDWDQLVSVARAPQYEVASMNGPQIQYGFRDYHAAVAPQLLPLIRAILNAEDRELVEAQESK